MKFNVSEFLRFLAPALGFWFVLTSQEVVLIFCIANGLEDIFSIVAASFAAGLITCLWLLWWNVVRPLRQNLLAQEQLLAAAAAALVQAAHETIWTKKKPERVEGDEWKDTQ
jgi:hypothetical protein